MPRLKRDRLIPFFDHRTTGGGINGNINRFDLAVVDVACLIGHLHRNGMGAVVQQALKTVIERPASMELHTETPSISKSRLTAEMGVSVRCDADVDHAIGRTRTLAVPQPMPPHPMRCRHVAQGTWTQVQPRS